MRRVLLSVLVASVLAGCASTDVKDEGAPVENRKPDVVTGSTTKPAPLAAFAGALVGARLLKKGLLLF